MEDAAEERKQADPRDLIDEYEAYLNQKKIDEAKMAEEEGERNADQPDAHMAAASTFTQNLDMFDYALQKTQIRERFHEWLANEPDRAQSLALLGKFKN